MVGYAHPPDRASLLVGTDEGCLFELGRKGYWVLRLRRSTLVVRARRFIAFAAAPIRLYPTVVTVSCSFI